MRKKQKLKKKLKKKLTSKDRGNRFEWAGLGWVEGWIRVDWGESRRLGLETD